MALDLGLEGKVAFVTASTRGIGRAIALLLAEQGMKVAVTGRSHEALNELARAINKGPGEALAIPLDLTVPGAIKGAIDQVLAKWGRLDVAVGNGPGPAWGSVESITVQQWEEALRVNLLSMVDMVHAVLPPMKKQGGGRIHFIATVGVRVAQPNMVLSNAVRLALVGLAKTLAIEVASHNILVNVIAPGPIESDRMQELFESTAAGHGITLEEARQLWLQEVPLKRMGKPEDIASLVALLSSDRCSFVTGTVITVDGGKSPAY